MGEAGGGGAAASPCPSCGGSSPAEREQLEQFKAKTKERVTKMIREKDEKLEKFKATVKERFLQQQQQLSEAQKLQKLAEESAAKLREELEREKSASKELELPNGKGENGGNNIDSDLKERCLQQERELAELKELYRRSDESLKRVEKELEHEKSMAKETKLSENNDLLERCKSELQERIQELENAKQGKSAAEVELKQVQQELELERNTSSEKDLNSNALKAELAKQGQDLAAEKERCLKAQTDLQKAMEELEQSKHSNEEKGKSLKRLEIELEQEKEQRRKAEEELAEREHDKSAGAANAQAEEAESLEAFKAEAQERMLEKDREIAEAKEKLGQCENDLEKLQAGLERERDAIREQVANEKDEKLETFKTLAKERFQKQQQELNEAQKQRAQAEEALQKAQAELEREKTTNGEELLRQLEVAKQAYTEKTKNLEDSLMKQLEEKNTAIVAMQESVSLEKEQCASLKELLRVSEEDRVELRSALERAHNENESLGDQISESNTNTESELKIAKSEIERAQEEARRANTLYEQEKTKIDGIHAEAVAARLDLEAKIEALETQIEALETRLTEARAENADNRHKYRLYIDSMTAKQAKKLNDVQEQSNRALQVAMEKELARHTAELSKAKSEHELESQQLRGELEAAESQAALLEKRYRDHIAATEERVEAIKRQEKELNTIMTKKLSETEQHKRLRQQAKTETMALAAKLDERSAALDEVTRSVEDILIPRQAQIASSVQQIEWSLDSALATSAERDDSNKPSLVQLFFARNQEPSTTTELAQIVTAASNETSSLASESQDEGSLSDHMPDLEDEEAANGPNLLRRSSSVILFTSNRVKKLQRRVGKTFDDLQRVLEKVKHVCDLAVEEKSAWDAVSGGVRRSVEDCLVASSIVRATGARSNRTQAAGGAAHVQLRNNFS